MHKNTNSGRCSKLNSLEMRFILVFCPSVVNRFAQSGFWHARSAFKLKIPDETHGGSDVTIPVRNLGTGLRRGLAYRFGTKSIRGNSRPLMLLLGGIGSSQGARISY